MATKVKSRSQTQSKERAKRRAIIYNTWGDKKLANEAKSWSKSRIYFELGINVDNYKRKPKERVFSEKGLNQQKRKLGVYQHAITYQFKTYGNYDIDTVKNYAQLGYTKKRTVRLLDAKIQANMPFDNLRKDIPKKVQKRDRTALWSEWAKNDSFYPMELTQWARYLNKKHGFPKDAEYGWGVVYFAYTNFEHPEGKWEDTLLKRVVSGSGIYKSFTQI
ncbi:MAG: hypothetical protein QXI16_00440 [Sulfolobaceae archaeon]